MDKISYAHADDAHSKIDRVNNDPDSTDGIVTHPEVIGVGETITIPAGRQAVVNSMTVDGTLTIDGTLGVIGGGEISPYQIKMQDHTTSVWYSLYIDNGQLLWEEL